VVAQSFGEKQEKASLEDNQGSVMIQGKLVAFIYQSALYLQCGMFGFGSFKGVWS
jgi:hypothetical protein